MRTVLFVCTGNTCRSPMAEAIARQALASRPELRAAGAVFVASAGVAAWDGQPVNGETLDALRRIGIDHQGTATALNRPMVENADVVFVMTDSHAHAVRDLLGDDDPALLAKVLRLDPNGDLEDPIGLGPSAYNRLATHLASLIPARLQEFLLP